MKVHRSSLLRFSLLALLIVCPILAENQPTVEQIHKRVLANFDNSQIDGYKLTCSDNNIDPNTEYEMSDSERESIAMMNEGYQPKAVDALISIINDGTFMDSFGIRILSVVGKYLVETIISIILAIIIASGLLLAFGCVIFNALADLIEGRHKESTNTHSKIEIRHGKALTKKNVENAKKSMRVSICCTVLMFIILLALGIVLAIYIIPSYTNTKHIKCASASLLQVALRGDGKSFPGVDAMSFLYNQYSTLYTTLTDTNVVPKPGFTDAGTLPAVTGDAIALAKDKLLNTTDFEYYGKDSVTLVASPGVKSQINNAANGALKTEATLLNSICDGIGAAKSALSKAYTTADTIAALASLRTIYDESNLGLLETINWVNNNANMGSAIISMVRRSLLAAILIGFILNGLLILFLIPVLIFIWQSLKTSDDSFESDPVITQHEVANYSQQKPNPAHMGEPFHVAPAQNSKRESAQALEAKQAQTEVKDTVNQSKELQKKGNLSDPRRMNPDYVDLEQGFMGSEIRQSITNLHKIKVTAGYVYPTDKRQKMESEKMFIDKEDFREEQRIDRLHDEFPESFGERNKKNEVETTPVGPTSHANMPAPVPSSREVKPEQATAQPTTSQKQFHIGEETPLNYNEREVSNQNTPTPAAAATGDEVGSAIPYTKSCCGLGWLRCCYTTIMILVFFSSMGTFIYTWFSLPMAVGMGTGCKAYRGARTHGKGWAKANFNSGGKYLDSHTNIIDTCLSTEANYTYTTSSLNADMKNMINGLYGIGTYIKNTAVVDIKPPTEGTKAVNSMTTLVGFTAADSDGNAQDVEAAIQDFNKRKCAKDEFHYKGQCSSSSIVSTTSDAVTASVGSDYCVQMPDISNNPTPTSPYKGRYAGGTYSCSTGSFAEGEISLSTAGRVGLSYVAKVTALKTKVEALNTAETTCQNDAEGAKTGLQNIYNDNTLKPYIDMQTNLGVGASSIGNCKFYKTGMDRAEVALCMKLYKKYYIHAILGFVFAIAMLVFGLCMCWSGAAIDNAWDLSTNPPSA